MTSVLQRVVRVMISTGFLLAGIFGTLPLGAQADDAGPGVARISLIKGGVDIKRADSGDTLAAAVNAPLSVGDYLSTRNDARSELQLSDRTSLRAGANTQLRVSNLDAVSHVLQLAAGTVELRLFDGNAAHPEVDTPGVAVRPDEKGRYRVSVDADGNTLVTVRSGAAHVVAQNATQTLHPGSSLEISGDGANSRVHTVAEIGRDSFDAWNDDRDRYEGIGASYAYVDPAIVGADDLGRYGSWVDEPNYGEVWHPTYAAGWAPYHDGQWVWEPYYGWTWVGAEPWGWAPYHYGRWFYAADQGWCWYPQPVAYAAPVYRPALVAFFSFGGLSFGFGNIGWVPLAPYEALNPWWGNGYGFGSPVFTHVTNITTVNNITNNNITNVTNVTNINKYRNISAPGGAVAVNTANFKGGRFAHLITVTPKQAATAKLVNGIVPIVPSVENLAYTSRPGAPVKSDSIVSRFKRFPPTAAKFAIPSFAQQQAAVASLTQRTSPGQRSYQEHPERGAPSGRLAPRDASLHAPSPNGAARAQAEPPSPWDRFAPKVTQLERRAPMPRAATTVTHDPLETHPQRSAWDRFDRLTPSGNAAGAVQHASATRTRSTSSSDPFARFDSRSLRTAAGRSDHHTPMPSSYVARPSSSYGAHPSSYGAPPSSYGEHPGSEPHAQSGHERTSGPPAPSHAIHDARYGGTSPRLENEYERRPVTGSRPTSPAATTPRQPNLPR